MHKAERRLLLQNRIENHRSAIPLTEQVYVCMYMYLYLYMYLCVCIYIYIRVYVYVYVHLYVHVWSFAVYIIYRSECERFISLV